MLEIEELLNERKDYMRETCPAYRLVCAEHEALVEILGSWPGISEAFRSYEAYRHMVALRYCAACYQKNKKLSDLSAEGIFTYGEDDISQEKIGFPPGRGQGGADGISYAEQVGRRKGKAAELILGQLPDRRAIPGRFRGHV